MDDSLSFESFFGGAKKAAHRAMDDHGRGEYDEFALHAGVAVERLAKAVLVKRNPVYLVEMRNNNLDLLLYFGGDLEMDTRKVRTVGAKDAIQRLRRMGILPPQADLDLLIELRNGTAHTTSGDQAETLLPAFAETVAVLLTALATTFRDFWGRWARTVIVAIDKRRDEIGRDVEIRIDQARHRFDDRFSELSEHLKESLFIEQATSTDVLFFDTKDGTLQMQGRQICPACQSMAAMSSVNRGTNSTPAFVAVALHCSMCQLQLADRDELAAGGISLEEADGRLARYSRDWLSRYGTKSPAKAAVQEFLSDDSEAGES
ncbi:hypothetical protein [Streptomyces tendae]|uniref:hypothetical protein n=1 Tax=Streptomyces tendae TaxID=1932 RepID=UPI003D72AECA